MKRRASLSEHVTRVLALVLVLGASALVVGCYNQADLKGPVVWTAQDRQPIPEPEEEKDGQWTVWDGTDKMFFYRIGQVLHLGRSLRNLGTWVGLADPIEAQNVNALDEVPDSTWFTNRHAVERLSSEELARGANRGRPPAPDGLWTVISGKESLGSTPGFVIRDGKEDVYLIKFDPWLNPEMTTAAEVITPKFLYAAGYNVPEHYLVSVDPAKLAVDPSAMIRGRYNIKRRMTEHDVRDILARVPHRPDGSIRAVASKWLPGIPKGPFLYEGRRSDDANDHIRHENRRELRGLRILAAFLNHTDTKAPNALDTYDPQARYLTHYLIDFSSTLGADNADPQLPRFGNEYFLDFGTIGLSTIALGAYVKDWTVPLRMDYPAVGYFEAARFDPERWVPTYPNPAFLRTTLRDAYWGAKLVTAFTDGDIDTIVHTGEFSDPRAERYVADILKARRDKIGRTYFNLVNPLDRVALVRAGTGSYALVFENLALTRGYAPSERPQYRYTIKRSLAFQLDPAVAGPSVVSEPRIPLDAGIEHSGVEPIYVILQTSYDGGRTWSPAVEVYLRSREGDDRLEIVAIHRET